MPPNDLAPLRPDLAPGEVLAPPNDFAPPLNRKGEVAGRGQARRKTLDLAPAMPPLSQPSDAD
jgi:hypothetical protein